MNPLAGLVRGHSRNGKSHPLSERDAYMRLYGDRPNGNHAVRAAVPASSNGRKRPRDTRGRFLPRD